jgi:hypothetical protein
MASTPQRCYRLRTSASLLIAIDVLNQKQPFEFALWAEGLWKLKAGVGYLFDKLKNKRSAPPSSVTVIFRGPKGSLTEDIALTNGQAVVPQTLVDRIAAQIGEVAEISIAEKKK